MQTLIYSRSLQKSQNHKFGKWEWNYKTFRSNVHMMHAGNLTGRTESCGGWWFWNVHPFFQVGILIIWLQTKYVFNLVQRAGHAQCLQSFILRPGVLTLDITQHKFVTFSNWLISWKKINFSDNQYVFNSFIYLPPPTPILIDKMINPSIFQIICF